MTGKTVVVTGCSDGGLGAALAIAYKKAGYRVLATGRNPAKLGEMKRHEIETVELEATSGESIKQAASKVSELLGGKLDVLVNNAGSVLAMPILDTDVDAARKMFEVNVYAPFAVVKEFLPLLRASGPTAMVVNNTSVSGMLGMPLQGYYNASKAAAAALTRSLRLELEPFGVRVVELKTGAVRTGIFANSSGEPGFKLPEDSLYAPARDVIEDTMTGKKLLAKAPTPDEWATGVVSDLNRSSPPRLVWRGGSAFAARFGPFIPEWFIDGIFRKMTGLDVLAAKLKEQGGAGVKRA